MILPGLMPLIYLFPRRLAAYILRHQDIYSNLINIAVDLFTIPARVFSIASYSITARSNEIVTLLKRGRHDVYG